MNLVNHIKEINTIKENLPVHVAIIMDGNGRWATERGKGRTLGHREGAKRVDEIVTECCRLGIKFLTLYAFSTENWNRPSYEVSVLMRLLVHHLKTLDKKLIKNSVKLAAQGSLHRLPKYVQLELARVIQKTDIQSPALTLNLSLSYGGRQEIVDCAKEWVKRVVQGEYALSDIDEKTFRRFLYHPEIPDPDLLIRTGGECRISNFLLWEIAYSEFVVTDLLWPDFNVLALHDALTEFSSRERRFGKTSAQIRLESSEEICQR